MSLSNSFTLEHHWMEAQAELIPDLEGSCCSALGYAAKHGDLKLMQALLDAGAAANPEIMDRALFDSAYNGHLDAFHLLLANGASVKTHDPGGWTLLMAAASSGSPAMLKEILKSDKDVNAIAHIPRAACESEDHSGKTSLRLSCAGIDWPHCPDGSDLLERL